ncbi:fumarylacetoacetate hydrolase family protein [Cryptosporangium sp. NPDC051539]|uniref:fumarylacetoacetate hydrolase family protein n=1 Tax=Cryptosporangium sp. NPDC051539 TaxID=3363962 RepID=UPI00378F5B44
MKLLTSRSGAGWRVGAVTGDTVHDVRLDGRGWDGGLRELLAAAGGDPRRITVDSGPGLALASVEVGPLLPDPSKIVAAPVNYVDHQAEMNEATHIDGLGVFLKAPSSVLAHHGVVRLPYDDRRFDQEGELALVIGRTARDVPAEDALSYVFGYTCLLDITMRGGEDRSTRKSFDTFTPIGPWLVTPDEVGDLGSLRLRCSVGGTLRQDASIGDLIWDVPALIAYVSSVMTLVPGDVLSTGTPAGVGTIADGDTISVTISRIGTLTVSVSGDGARHCPTKGVGRGPVPPAEVTPLRSRG